MPEASHDIIDEVSFARLLSGRIGSFVSFLNLLRSFDATGWKKRHYAELRGLAHDIETFLDDYEARNNRSFAYVTELVASLRGLANVGLTLMHLAARYPRYNVSLEPGVASKFFEETEHTVRFLQRSVVGIIRELHEELVDKSVDWTDRMIEDSTVGEDPHTPSLPHNIDEEDLLDEPRKIAEVATGYLGLVEEIGSLGQSTVEDPARLKSLVLERIDEERCREIESLVHSIQSKYDTYVRSTVMESKTPVLRSLRGHVSMALHLFEMATELVHFYVRHENDIRYEAAKQGIARLVDKGEVLDRAINYTVHFGVQVLRAGTPLANEALSSFVQTSRYVATIPPGTTLHARPISLIVKIVNHHGTRVELEIAGERCNAGSIMEIIMIAGNQPEVREVVFEGDARPLDDLKILFDHGLGERGSGDLPEALDYLR